MCGQQTAVKVAACIVVAIVTSAVALVVWHPTLGCWRLRVGIETLALQAMDDTTTVSTSKRQSSAREYIEKHSKKDLFAILGDNGTAEAFLAAVAAIILTPGIVVDFVAHTVTLILFAAADCVMLHFEIRIQTLALFTVIFFYLWSTAISCMCTRNQRIHLVH